MLALLVLLLLLLWWWCLLPQTQTLPTKQVQARV
jgi:hypothetical protein